MPQILIVDDQEPIRLSLGMILEDQGHRCHFASDAEEALLHIEQHRYELVLCDINLPGMSGIELVKQLTRHHPEIAVVMVTAMDDPFIAEAATDNGAYGYILKPFHPNLIYIHVANALRRRQLELEHRSSRLLLESAVAQRTQELTQHIERLKHTELSLKRSQEETIQRLARAAEFRDGETAQHIQRMSSFTALLGRLAGLTHERVEMLRLASPMHDVGKLGIPDSILLKPGRLTPAEFQIMQEHAMIGYRILSGSSSELLELGAVIALTHHEKYNGTGYPRRLVGTQIPIEGRITAIADVFDALTSRRVYKEVFPLERTLSILRENRGTHFDPELLDIFLENLDAFLILKQQYTDPTPASEH